MTRVAALLVVSLVFGRPLLEPDRAAAGAMVCGFCSDQFVEGSQVWQHNFSAGGALFNCEPNTCHSSWLTGLCGEFHYTCKLTLFEDRGGFGRLEKLLAAADWPALRAFANGLSAVHVRPGRGSLQVEDCQGRVIAYYQLPPEVIQLLAE